MVLDIFKRDVRQTCQELGIVVFDFCEMKLEQMIFSVFF